MRRRSASVLRTLLTTATTLVLLGAVAPEPASAADDSGLVTFGIGPVSDPGAPARPFLSYGLAPGSSVVDRVTAYNQSESALDLLVYTSDGINEDAGGLAVLERQTPNHDVGAWLRLGADAGTDRPLAASRSVVRVRVPAQSARGVGAVTVPLEVSVPRDAPPGDHVGGIAVALVATGSNPSSQNIELEQRVVTRVYVTVAGEVRPQLRTEVLRTTYEGGAGLGLRGRTRVRYRVTNTGNSRVGARSHLTVDGLLGLGHAEADGPSVAELVPGGSADLEAVVGGVLPAVRATTRLFVVGVRPPGATRTGPLPTSQARAAGWALVWQEVVAGVVLVLLLLAWLLRRRRPSAPETGPRHARSTGPGSGSPSRRSLALRRGVVVLCSGLLLPEAPHPALAADLGTVAVSPASGTDQTLFSGSVHDARCPASTGDSYWTVDGQDLAPDTAFLAPGNATGRGQQSFSTASVANLKSTNAGSFTHAGTYAVRFSCVRSQDGKVVDSYVRRLRYRPGGAGTWTLEAGPAVDLATVRQGPAVAATLPPPTPTPSSTTPSDPVPQERASASATPSPADQGNASSRPTAGGDPAAAPSVPRNGGSPVLPVLGVGVLALGALWAGAAVVGRRRRGSSS